MLADQLPWYVAGPLLGLLVVGTFALTSERLGVLGGLAEIAEAARRRTALGWRAWFVVGIVGGAAAHAALAPAAVRDGYGWMTGTLGGAGTAVVLLVAGGLIGYGARTAGGCTSGNGLSGCAFGSPASFVATGTFMGAAVVTAFAVRLLAGGAA